MTVKTMVKDNASDSARVGGGGRSSLVSSCDSCQNTLLKGVYSCPNKKWGWEGDGRGKSCLFTTRKTTAALQVLVSIPQVSGENIFYKYCILARTFLGKYILQVLFSSPQISGENLFYKNCFPSPQISGENVFYKYYFPSPQVPGENLFYKYCFLARKILAKIYFTSTVF